jgi:hypothetical protein
MHSGNIRVVLLIKGEISAAISVVNIQSDTVAGNFMLVEVIVDTKSVSLIFVGPSALMVTEREVLRHSTVTKDMRHASEVSGVRVAYEDVAVEVSSFTEPEGVSVSGSVLVNVNVSIRGVLPVHTYKSRGLLATGNNDGHSSIERALASDGIAGEILVVEIVRNISLGVFKEEAGGSFSKTVESISSESKISGNVFVELQALLSIELKHHFFSAVGSGKEGDLEGVIVNDNLDFNFSELDFS